tara:strand:- start:14809 stop:15144 length:336 start_codon:yes stop_codon:yes gene_type:complete
MTIKDKVHVTIGISRKNKDRYVKHNRVVQLEEILGISNSVARQLSDKIAANEAHSGSDFRAMIKLSYEQLGRYVAWRAENHEKDHWLWPEVVEVERPVPKKAHIFDISGAL